LIFFAQSGECNFHEWQQVYAERFDAAVTAAVVGAAAVLPTPHVPAAPAVAAVADALPAPLVSAVPLTEAPSRATV
jgi:hypothetical protein